MLVIKKLNLKKFFLFSLIPLIGSLLLARHTNDILGISIVFIATLFNVLVLAEGVLLLVESQKVQSRFKKTKSQKIKVIWLFILKFVVLILGLLFGVQMMGNRIIIPIINYVLQIFTLSISLKSGDDPK